jgi:uncharacterized protein YndB with AHSA1/START domain
MNGALMPLDVSSGSSYKAWWKCDVGDDHEWITSVANRSYGFNCPVCAGKKVVKSNCLLTTHPDLAKQWHPTMNKLTPYDVNFGSNKRVFWKCPDFSDHFWEASVNSRNKGSGCSICFKKSQLLSSLKENFISRATSVHGNKYDYSKVNYINAKTKVIITCRIHGEFLQKPHHHTEGQNCKKCSNRGTPLKGNSLAELNPDLAKQWHPNLNDITPFDVLPGSSKRAWWKCGKGDDHEWEAVISSRKKVGCPICSNKKLVLSNCLATTHPELAKQWHPTKNNLKPFDVFAGSGKKVWWKCDKGNDHEWKAAPNDRKSGNNCPVCAGQKIVLSNCLATTHPELAKQWHPTKNQFTPFEVISGSHQKAWWKCEKGDDHVWEADIVNRSKGKSCPVCSGRKAILSNCLATTHPLLAKQWHPTKNKDLTPFDVKEGSSSKKVWWKCDKGEDHEWQTSVVHRTYGTNCPFCDLTPQSKQELTITFELLRFFKDINPRGFKTRVKGKLWSIDIYIPQLNLGIEFDGSYWHKDKRALDKLKTEQLEEDGFEIFRVREEPLKRIFDDDIMSKKPFNGKQLTNDILNQIMSRYTLDAKKISKLETYIAKKELQNENGLDKYINMILTEKAEKKQLKNK